MKKCKVLGKIPEMVCWRKKTKRVEIGSRKSICTILLMLSHSASFFPASQNSSPSSPQWVKAPLAGMSCRYNLWGGETKEVVLTSVALVESDWRCSSVALNKHGWNDGRLSCQDIVYCASISTYVSQLGILSVSLCLPNCDARMNPSRNCKSSCSRSIAQLLSFFGMWPDNGYEVRHQIQAVWQDSINDAHERAISRYVNASLRDWKIKIVHWFGSYECLEGRRRVIQKIVKTKRAWRAQFTI